MKKKQYYKLRTCILTWLGLFPTIIFVSFLLGDFLEEINTYLRTILLTSIVIPLMVYVVMPLINKLYYWIFGCN